MGIKEAIQKCPSLVLINGEDLTPYRTASKRLRAVLQRFGPLEKLGMDEVFVDVTKEVHIRLRNHQVRLYSLWSKCSSMFWHENPSFFSQCDRRFDPFVARIRMLTNSSLSVARQEYSPKWTP